MKRPKDTTVDILRVILFLLFIKLLLDSLGVKSL